MCHRKMEDVSGRVHGSNLEVKRDSVPGVDIRPNAQLR